MYRKRNFTEVAMSERKPQTYANHTRFDPVFYYFLAPVLLITVILSLFIW